MYAYHQLAAKYDLIEYVMDELFGRISGWTRLDIAPHVLDVDAEIIAKLISIVFNC